jgi:hypothetical protein
MKFPDNNKTCINLNIHYDKTTEEVSTTKLLGLQTDGVLNWKKKCIEHVVSKPSSACFSMRLSHHS